jgi:hypothetical protein
VGGTRSYLDLTVEVIFAGGTTAIVLGPRCQILLSPTQKSVAAPTSSATPWLICRLRCGAALEFDIMCTRESKADNDMTSRSPFAHSIFGRTRLMNGQPESIQKNIEFEGNAQCLLLVQVRRDVQ